MIKYSTTFPDRTVCKFCLQPADMTNEKPYMSELFSDKKLHRGEYFDPKYLVPISLFDPLLKNRTYGKIKLGYVNYVSQTSLKVSFYRRKLNKMTVKKEDLPKVCICPCGKSCWIDYSYSNEVIVENNRKSKI